MEGPPTYDDPLPEPPAYTIDSYAAAAVASMPAKPFHERNDDESGRTHHP